MKIFAAIDVGSYEVGMKIFQLSKKYGLKELDYIRHRVDLGSDSYRTGRISYDHMEELCSVLNGFNDIMSSYGVDDYRACGTSAIREAESTDIVLDQIRLRTGLDVRALSNSEQRFLDYKSVALQDVEKFENIIKDGTLFIDIGGGSTQVSLFQEGSLITTVNLPLGILRIRSQLSELEPRRSQYSELLSEIIDNELYSFKKLYLNNSDIKNMVVVDDYLPYVKQRLTDNGVLSSEMVTTRQYLDFCERIKQQSVEEVAKAVGIPQENANLLRPSAALIRNFINITGAQMLWITGATLSDGIAYDYAERTHIIKSAHDFDSDIIASAENIAARYRITDAREEALLQVSMVVFDSMKKFHGLSKRDRLLLELAARLRDVGRFVSLSVPAESSYSIIMGTEIIGLSHMERAMVASAAINSFSRDVYYRDIENEEFDKITSLRVVKITAILRLAAALAQNPGKRFKKVTASIRDNELDLTIGSKAGIVLESGDFAQYSQFFEEVYGIRPVIRHREVSAV